MWAFDEIVTIRDRDGVEYGRCRMLGWVSRDDGVKRWHGELMGIDGRFFDIALVQVERKALYIECENDGATARILPPTMMDAQSTGTRCFFEGVWPPPRPVG